MKKQLSFFLASCLLLSSLAACGGAEPEVPVADEAPAKSEAETPKADATPAEDEMVFATMNMPYNDFYAAELSDNSVPVDAVSSATPSKWKGDLYPASYFAPEGDGGVIYGPQCPVQLSKTLFDELSALGESDDYFVTALDSEPATYKEVSGAVGSLDISEMKGATSTAQATVSETFPSNYGDFEMYIDCDALPDVREPLYGVKVVTADGKSYGLRDLENIWVHSGDLSWGLGYTEKISKGNTLSSDHYADMQGKTITECVYYLPETTVSIPMELYVPVYFTDRLFTVGEQGCVNVEDGKATMDYKEGVEIPSDYAITLQATTKAGDPVEGITLSDDFTTVSWAADVPVGMYKLSITDANGKYQSTASNVTLQTGVQPVAFDAASMSFAPANDASAEVVAAYLEGITSFTVTKDGEEEGVRYSTQEHHGTPGTLLLTEEGVIDTAAVNADGNAVYEAGATYIVSFTVTGYTANSFTFTA